MTSLLIFCLLTSLAIQAIYICVHWEGMILNFIQPYVIDLPGIIGHPLCNCPICMASFWTIAAWFTCGASVTGIHDCAKIVFAITVVAGINAILSQVIEYLRLSIRSMNYEEERTVINGFSARAEQFENEDENEIN